VTRGCSFRDASIEGQTKATVVTASGVREHREHQTFPWPAPVTIELHVLRARLRGYLDGAAFQPSDDEVRN
jgi:hypothetical protein